MQPYKKVTKYNISTYLICAVIIRLLDSDLSQAEEREHTLKTVEHRLFGGRRRCQHSATETVNNTVSTTCHNHLTFILQLQQLANSISYVTSTEIIAMAQQFNVPLVQSKIKQITAVCDHRSPHHTGNHMPYGITLCYLPPSSSDPCPSWYSI